MKLFSVVALPFLFLWFIYHPVKPVVPTPPVIPTPVSHTHVCQGPDGSYMADNSVGCMHQCTLSDGTTYWAAAGLACARPNPTPFMGQMPTPHTHVCTYDGVTYEADVTAPCPK